MCRKDTGKGSRKMEVTLSIPVDAELTDMAHRGMLAGCVHNEQSFPTNPAVVPPPGKNGKCVTKLTSAEAASMAATLCASNPNLIMSADSSAAYVFLML